MIYTLFFSKLRNLSLEGAEEYESRSNDLRALAEAEHPGFIGMKTYIADDGDRLTVARFRDAESQRAWRRVPAHREAQARGRTHYYERFEIVVCEELRSHRFERESDDGPAEKTVP